MAYEYFFMFGTEMLSQETAARVVKEWGLNPADHFCDGCEKPLTSRKRCPDNEGPHPWRMHFMAMGNALQKQGDIAMQIMLAEQMSLVPIEPTIKKADTAVVQQRQR